MEQTPTPSETISENHDLLWKLINTFNQHVTELVDKRVNQIFEAHATVKHLDEQWEERIKGFVQEAIDEHVSDFNHHDMEDIQSEVQTQIQHTDFERQIRTAVQDILNDGDYTTEDRVTEMIDEADIEDQVKEVLRNI